MDPDHQREEDSPLCVGSQEALVALAGPPRGGSNRRAFKVAGLTVLACLLLATQALTAYMVIGQKQQIQTLQKNSENMHKQLTRKAQVAPVQMHMPMNNMPLLMDFSDAEPKKTKTPMTQLEDTSIVSVEKQVKDLLQVLMPTFCVFGQNSELPKFNETFLANLQSLKKQTDENEWKGFETWMRQWLIFQMAQEMPPVPPTTEGHISNNSVLFFVPPPAIPLRTHCQLAAAPGAVRPGFFKPHCDEQGNYFPVQCWHSTGYCWCVDQAGTEKAGTLTRGRPKCDEGRGDMQLLKM
ncbi:H-2 class II histocompatibility antigen gamma chain-like [Aplochiton taeniatus]